MPPSKLHNRAPLCTLKWPPLSINCTAISWLYSCSAVQLSKDTSHNILVHKMLKWSKMQTPSKKSSFHAQIIWECLLVFVYSVWSFNKHVDHQKSHKTNNRHVERNALKDFCGKDWVHGDQCFITIRTSHILFNDYLLLFPPEWTA